MNQLQRPYTIQNQYHPYFITITVVGWIDIFTRYQCIQIIINALRYCITKKGLTLYAYVIMSNHIHMLAEAKEGSIGLSGIIRDFKKYTCNQLIKWIQTSKKESRKNWMLRIFKEEGEKNSNNKFFKIWQPHNRPITLMYPRFTLQKMNYIHNNPVTAGIVDKAEDYVFSSARNYAGDSNYILEVVLLDFGVLEGFLGI